MESQSILSLEDLTQFTQTWAKQLTTGGQLIGLSGPLGVGKTTFVQTLAKVLGSSDLPTSPTFTLRQTYQISQPSLEELIHVDLYRLENTSAIEELGLTEELTNPKAIILVEWIERSPDLLAQADWLLNFSWQADGSRLITRNRQ